MRRARLPARSRSRPRTLEDGLDEIQAFVDKRVKQLLVVEDDPVQSQAISDLIGDGDVETTTRRVGRDRARRRSPSKPYDCVVLDLRLPGHERASS